MWYATRLTGSPKRRASCAGLDSPSISASSICQRSGCPIALMTRASGGPTAGRRFVPLLLVRGGGVMTWIVNLRVADVACGSAP